MAGAFGLGVFNDNFYKQAAIVMAVAAGLTAFQGYASLAFTLPFLVLAPLAGWLADRFPKRRVVIGAKWVELLAMLAGAAGVALMYWPLIFVMLVLMGMQAAVFSPALNGSIPELYPEDYVAHANGILRTVVSAAIMGGVACGGAALEWKSFQMGGIPAGRLLVAGVVVLVAVAGLLLSYGIPWRPAAAPHSKFPWDAYGKTFRDLWGTRRDPPLAFAVAASVFVWFVGVVEVLIISPLGLQQYKIGEAATGGLSASQLVGIGIGGLLAGRLTRKGRWFRLLVPSGFIMVAGLLALAAVPHLGLVRGEQIALLYLFVAVVGTGAGLFMIPIESFIQVRPPAGQKGSILAAANFAVFAGISVGALISNGVNCGLPLSKIPGVQWQDLPGLRPTDGMGALGLAALFITLLLIPAVRKWGGVVAAKGS